MNKLLLAFSATCFCASITYAAEQVKPWFSGTTTTASNGAWVNPLPTGAAISGDVFEIDLDDGDALTFTPEEAAAPDTNVVTRVTCEVAFVPVVTTPFASPGDGAQTAIIAYNGFYYAYLPNESSWVKLVGATPSGEDTVVKVLTEVDHKLSNNTKVRFAIVNGSTPAYLYVEGGAAGDWISLGNPVARKVCSIACAGSGKVKSVEGKMQLGLFQVGDTKFGTADEAVAAANADGSDGKVVVLKDNNEKITIPEGSTIALDTNGKNCGEIDNQSTDPIDVKLPAADVAQGSGVYEIDATTTDATKINIVSTDESKEVAVTTDPDSGKLLAVVQTSAEIMDEVKFLDKAVAPADNADYRAFLATYCGASDGAYMKANTTSAEIISQLDGTIADGNGLKVWQSYVLDLDPTDPTSKPAAIVKPATADTDNMVLTVPTYKATLPDSNYTVSYVLKNVTTGDTTAITDPTTVTIPFDGGKYRVDTVITPKN